MYAGSPYQPSSTPGTNDDDVWVAMPGSAPPNGSSVASAVRPTSTTFAPFARICCTMLVMLLTLCDTGTP
jgi:hypothetical protein